MFSSRIIDKKNSCDIIKHSLMDDLYPYKIDNNGNLIFTDNQFNGNLSSKINLLSTLINDDNKDVWLPIFIRDDQYVKTKVLSDYGAYANGNPTLLSGRLGIENFYTFTPQFKSWDVSTNSTMSIDWLLNKPNTYYSIYYGILGWYRQPKLPSNRVYGGNTDTIENFPNGSRLKHSSQPNVVYIKISDTILYNISRESKVFNSNGSWTFNDESETCLVDISSFGADPKFSLSDKYYSTNQNNFSNPTINNINNLDLPNDSYLWIADGDFFSYFNSDTDKNRALAKNIPSNSYISASLYNTYSNIYRILTLDEPRSFDNRDLKKSRAYKKLAQLLSTSPFSGDFSLYALDYVEIRKLIQEYIRDPGINGSLDNEISNLQTIITNISKILNKEIITASSDNKSLFLDTKSSFKTINNNLITNHSQLFAKLINKYGANLLASYSTTISTKPNLIPDNYGICISKIAEYVCDKTLKQQTIISDETIQFGNQIKIRTDLNTQNNSSLNLYSNVSENLSIPLYNKCKPEYNKAELNIWLKYSANIPGTNRKSGISFNPDGSVDTYIYEMNLNGSIQTIELAALVLNIESFASMGNGVLSESDFLDSQINTTWEQLDGPEGYFGTSPINNSKIGNSISFYTKYSGKFTVQCTSFTPFGAFQKQKTFYIVDGREVLEGKDSDNNFFIGDNTLYGRYLSGSSWIFPPNVNPYASDNQPIVLNKDELRVIIPNINRIAINNLSGILWPIKTNMLVREDVGSRFKSRLDAISELSGSKYQFKYDNKTILLKNESQQLSLSFLSQNVIMKINALFLERIRTHQPECMHCLSFYEPKIISQQKAVQSPQAGTPGDPDFNPGSNIININASYRDGKNPAFFTLSKYKYNSSIRLWDFDQNIAFSYPDISTKFAPQLKTYGGYSSELVSALGVNIPEHPAAAASGPDPIIADNPSIMPRIDGYKLDYVDQNNGLVMCYQKALPLTPTTGAIISFDKGVLHPNSGWLPFDSDGYKIHANKCSVLKFNPGARDSFSFIGPSLSNLYHGAIHDYEDSMVVNTKIFSSTIELGISEHIQWEPGCSSDKDINTSNTRYNHNQQHKEYADIHYHTSNHGYRILDGGFPKASETNALVNTSASNDEFRFNYDANSNTASYFFAVTGPSLPLDKIQQNGRLNIRDPRVNNFGIKDIEIKLNFLNYVNTKNLVVWLEATLDETESRDRYPKRPNTTQRSPIRSNTEFLDQHWDPQIMDGNWSNNLSSINNFDNKTILNYIKSLTSMNSNKKGEPFRLFLLNQETIQNNGYNFCVKFSDNASKFNTPYDLNIQPTATGNFDTGTPRDMLDHRQSVIFNPSPTAQLSIYQNIIRSNDTLLPTVATTGYSDRESCLYNSILKYNKLNLNNNTLNKFVSNTIFRGNIPEPLGEGLEFISPDQTEPDYNGKTKFTLKMMILDEIDDMYPSDNISNQYKFGLDTIENKEKSPNITNSLCNWELVLHVGPVAKPVPRTTHSISSYGSSDSLSLLDYDKAPSYPGYSFVADLTHYKHLLPLANYNAPLSCIQDLTTCISDKYNDPAQNNGLVVKFSQYPDFFQTALVKNLAGVAAAAVFGGGSVYGTLASLSIADSFLVNISKALFDSLKELKFITGLQDVGRQIFASIYNKYPFGSPEKILINFKKPNSLWYSTEAAIFKYHNTPILKPNKYKFIRMQRGNGKYISEFKFTIINDVLELVDNSLIKPLDYDCNKFDSLKNTISYPIQVSGILINHGDLVDVNLINTSGQQQCSELSGIYIALQDDSWTKITSTTADKLSQTIHYLNHNIILSGGKQFFDTNFKTYIDNQQIILINSRIPYDMFQINDVLECYEEQERLDTTPESLSSVKIINKALIVKNNQYYSVLILDKSITTQNMISPKPESHIFFIYNNRTTIENKINKKYNIWGLDQNKTLSLPRTPELSPNTHSLGSYGDLSPFLYKNLLTNNIYCNKLLTNHEIFNNRDNDRLKYNKITVYDDQDKVIDGFRHSSCYGFSYSEQDINLKLWDIKNLAYYITPEDLAQTGGDPSSLFDELKTQIKTSTSTTKDQAYSYSYIRANISNTNTPLPSSISFGNLSIENDFVEYIPVRILNQEELTQLTDRLELIDNQNYTGVDSFIGDPEQTSNVLNSSNLSSLIKHYNQLPDDPAKCHRPGNTNKNICYKHLTQQRINDLYIERKEILDLLSYQTIKYMKFSYTQDDNLIPIDGEVIYENSSSITIKSNDIIKQISRQDIAASPAIHVYYRSRSSLSPNDSRYLDPKILPKVSPEITSDPTTQAITITYNPINMDHYWINIDPKQCTFKDFDSNPKVLIETRYTCALANPINLSDDRPSIIKNNVCPLLIETERPQGNDGNIDEVLTITPPNKYKYTINEKRVEQAKLAFEEQYTGIIKNWKKYTKTRYFNINGDQTFDIAPALEITVTSEEDYWIPITDEDNEGSIALQANDLSADAATASQKLPGMQPCIQGTSSGSPAGYGLLNSFGDRIRTHCRVCNVVNLDKESHIQVMVKRIPRILRGSDLLYTVYRYGTNSIYRQTDPTNPIMPNEIDSDGKINNSLYYWTCFKTNPVSKNLEKAPLPDFFKLQNEMIFRALFGSVDKIENRTDSLMSYYPWELIPYEYLDQSI